MKKFSMTMAALALLLGAASCNTKPGKVEPKTEKDSMAVAMGILYGTQMNQSISMARSQGQNMDSLEFLRGFQESLNDTTKFSYFAGGITAGNISKQLISDSVDLKTFYKSFYSATINDSTNMIMTMEEAQEYVEAVSAKKRAAEMEKKYGKNKAAGKEFMEKFLKEEGVQKTDSGIAYKILSKGKGQTPTSEDVVKVKYLGTLIDGTEFDKNEEGIEFPVSGVIAGWTEMLQLMQEGDKVKVVIPHDKAYGERGSGPSIEPFSTLVFEIELVKVQKK
ncbi:FKBP-type peptidyl-prolyl cis-trans isomerase [Porphyromonas macacae]|uniref:FKBP-type peptidyl-prolyl cis-trans isomerase n=1 Tax=Porphyromonas macacae TaxID=28115 RepID=UPI0024ADC39C|nr:FKBP-type peptidyl-prolyl cis-trans isomerase [Porphyromonas macacae]